MKTRYNDIKSYITRDGSTIRELMHPVRHCNRAQSLAEAKVAPGQITALHKHLLSEELYHITHGRGQMMLGDQEFKVAAGDTVCIPPGIPHRIRNTGTTPLRILCCCTPPYAHGDTILIEG